MITARPIKEPRNITVLKVFPEKIDSSGSLGDSFMTLGSLGSNPKAIAGRESLAKLIKSNCNAVKGLTQLSNKATKIAITAPKLPENR